MTIENISSILAWSFVLNYSLLIIWFAFFTLAHDWMYALHSRWFSIPAEKFDSIHYMSMAFYKLLIVVFNLVPYLAIRIAA